MFTQQRIQQIHFCPKILNLDTGYNEQTAYNYLKLLKQGCHQSEARKYSRKKRCQLDTTKKEIGPQNFECLKPIFDGSCSRMGWQAADSVKYNNDDGFRPSYTMDQLIDKNEGKILKMYDDYSNKFEKALRDRMDILNQFINERELQLNLDESLNRSDFVELLKRNTEQLNIIATSSFKYAKFRGIKLFEIVNLLESDIQRKQYLIQEKDSVIELPSKEIHNNKCSWDLASVEKKSRGSSAANYFFPQRIFHESLESSMERIELSQIPLTKQFGCFNPWFQNINHKDVKIKQTKDQSKKLVGMRGDFKRHSSEIVQNQLKHQSELCLVLLDEGGLGDSIDVNLKKIKNVKPPNGLVLELLKKQKSKLSLATDFNQSQYLFPVSNSSKSLTKQSKKCKKDKILDFCISTSLRGVESPKKLLKKKTLVIDSANFLTNQMKNSSNSKNIDISPSPMKSNDIQSSSSVDDLKSATFKASNFDAISEKLSEDELSFDFEYKIKSFMKGMISKINQKPAMFNFVKDSNVASLRQLKQSIVQKEQNKISKNIKPKQQIKRRSFINSEQNTAEQTQSILTPQPQKSSNPFLTCYSNYFSATNYVTNKISYKNVNKSQE